MAYLIAKSRMLRALGEILDFLGSLRSDAYDAVLNLEVELSRAHLQVPPYLLLSGRTNSADDHPSLISKRVQLEYLYHQGICMLHRRFFPQGRRDSRFSNSRERCIESALALLSLQDALHREATARGSLIACRWFRIPLASHDFILAAMILCLELRWRKEEEGSKEMKGPASRDDQQKAMLQSLQQSCNVLKQVQSSSADAWKVYSVLSSMLETLGEGERMGSSTHNGTPTSIPSDMQQPFVGFENGSALEGTSVPPLVDIDWVS